MAATKKIKKYRDRSKKGLPRAVHFKKAGLTSSDRDTLIKVKKTIPVNAGDNRNNSSFRGIPSSSPGAKRVSFLTDRINIMQESSSIRHPAQSTPTVIVILQDASPGFTTQE